jgi:multiple sugar transport system permease protein
VAYALLIAYALLMLIPFAWQVITSFKTDRDALRLTVIPDPFTLQGWETGFFTLDPSIPQLFLNSVIIAGAITLTNLVLASMAGYAFARLRFPLREALFIAVLGTLMIPDQLRFVPVYLIERQLGLITREPINYVGVVLILAVEAQQLFLMRQYFLSLPRDLEEAAKIDGASHFTTFLRVMLPLAGPALAAVSILAFQGAWNGFFWPLLILQSQDHWTLPLGLFSFKDQFLTQWPALMSVTVAAILPILLMYVFFQKYFVASVATTGVKG